VLDALLRDVVLHSLAVSRPGFSAFITTGATTVATLAAIAARAASSQCYGHTAFRLLEELSLRWLTQFFGDGRPAQVSGRRRRHWRNTVTRP